MKFPFLNPQPPSDDMIIDRKTGEVHIYERAGEDHLESCTLCRITNFAGKILSEWGRCFAAASLMAYGLCFVTSLVSGKEALLVVPNYQTIITFSIGAAVGYLGWGLKEGVHQRSNNLLV